MLDGCLPLRRTDIRTAPHPDTTVAPWLISDPLNRIESILTFVVVGTEHSFRREFAAAILNDGDISRSREPFRRSLGENLVVRGSHQHDRSNVRRVVTIDVRR